MKQKKRVKEGLIPADILTQHTVSTTTPLPPAINSSSSPTAATGAQQSNSKNMPINKSTNSANTTSNSSCSNKTATNATTLTDCQLVMQHSSDNSRESM